MSDLEPGSKSIGRIWEKKWWRENNVRKVTVKWENRKISEKSKNEVKKVKQSEKEWSKKREKDVRKLRLKWGSDNKINNSRIKWQNW
jgi:hypothetical protein